MAKSFKQLPAAGSGALGKVLSERDFFDLTEVPLVPTSLAVTPAAELVPTSGPPPVGAAVAPAGPADAPGPMPLAPNLPASSPGKRPTRRSAGNTSLPDKPEQTREIAYPLVESAALPSAGVRQTFVLGATYLEQLRDYVHDRRSRGDYLYSQRQALEEALDLLFAGSQGIAPRPASLREREQQRRVRIRAGRRAGTGGEPPPAS